MMKAKIYSDFDDFRDNGEHGAIEIRSIDGEVMGLAIKCPGCGSESWLQVSGPPPCWDFDGNHESPTLNPSVFHTKERGGCGWHGYLIKGVWQPV